MKFFQILWPFGNWVVFLLMSCERSICIYSGYKFFVGYMLWIFDFWGVSYYCKLYFSRIFSISSRCTKFIGIKLFKLLLLLIVYMICGDNTLSFLILMIYVIYFWISLAKGLLVLLNFSKKLLCYFHYLSPFSFVKAALIFIISFLL